MLSFISQLKAGKGLTLVAKCIQGDFIEKASLVEEDKNVSRFYY